MGITYTDKAPQTAPQEVGMRRLVTLLDLHDPSFDCAPGQVWRPRGLKVFNGIRQKWIRGFRL